ncbi:HAMP domain-containing sensor histidine kinase [Scleromatobacter humisilvae]|uniref:histidine kinase n=1 Tax=Scleromatobacter humisilvae TaxID=2897159 RepID=A0A9X1YMS1_9BURK|nr:sensor histidine kinase [Scleromatobacter humisilvae]
MAEFEAFAMQQLPAAAEMDVEALRDHARQVLEAIASDMRQPQTRREQREKSMGRAPRAAGTDASAAEIHGEARAAAGFDVSQTAAEYRALRASVIRLWMESSPTLGREQVIELTRFNEAMDEALAESILQFAGEAARMRNLFLGVLSHELRTPLSTIMASGQSLLLAARSGQVMPEAAERTLRGARRIQSLLDDLLDYVRSGLGEGMRVTPARVDMGQVCGRIVGELRASHPGRSIETEAVGDLACVCDAQRVAQAISNLLGNALRHGASGAAIRARVDGSAPDEVAVSVRNAGPPIPKATRESLFEPLVRGAGANNAGYNLGLGLYIVREIALAHGGSASVESDAESGTVFTLRIPRDASAAAASAFPGLRMN